MNIENEIAFIEGFYYHEALVEKPFFGRNAELNWFETAERKGNLQGTHWAIYGARRSGKTSLIQHYIQEQKRARENDGETVFLLQITGDNNLTEAKNNARAIKILESEFAFFLHEIDKKEVFFRFEKEGLSLWDDFFIYLKKVIKTVKILRPNVYFYFFFDEVMWLGKGNRFLSSYGYFINNQGYLELCRSTSFIACSSNNWMINEVLHNKTSLYKRLIHKEVKPFNFGEICDFFIQNDFIQDKGEILQYFLIFGGFLKHYKDCGLNFKRTLSQNLSDSETLECLKEYINTEVQIYFDGVFNSRRQFREITSEISKKKCTTFRELTKNERFTISESSLKKQLQELETAGVLKAFSKPNSKTKYYYTTISILRFFEFLQQNEWEKLLNNWKGEAFELLVLENIEKIKKHLAIKDSLTFLDVSISKKMLNKGGDELLTQCDILIEERRSNGREASKGRVFALEIKCRPVKNISKEELVQNEKRAVYLKSYYETFLNRKIGKVFSILVVPETNKTQMISFVDLLD